MAQTQVTFNDVFEDGDVEEVQKDPQTIHHIRANSSIMHLKKILGESQPSREAIGLSPPGLSRYWIWSQELC